ncbi:MAG: site-specific integrase, partial [candidate division WOR-3 bacterium]
MNSPQNIVQDFINYLQAERGLSPNTVESYKNDVVSFLEKTKKDIRNINREDIEKYLHSLDSSNFS